MFIVCFFNILSKLAVVGSISALPMDTLLLSENSNSNIKIYDKTLYFGWLSTLRKILVSYVDFWFQLFYDWF